MKKNQEMMKTIRLNGSHYSQIVRNADWKAKLDRLKVEENQELMKTIWLNGYHYSQIVSGANWKVKLDRLKEAENQELMRTIWLNGHHYSQIVSGADWKAKLDRLKVEENQELMKTIGLNGSHYSQIVKNADWKAKLDQLKVEENQELMKTIGLNGFHYSQIVRNGDWKAKLDRLKEHSLIISTKTISWFLLSQGLNQKEWKQRSKRFLDTIKYIDLINNFIYDERISPLFKPFLLWQLLHQHCTSDVILICMNYTTFENIEIFKSQINSIAWEQKTLSIKSLYETLEQDFWYSSLQIQCFLKAINKNNAGLLHRYKTGEMYRSYTISIDENPEIPSFHEVIASDDMTSTQTESQIAIEEFLDLIQRYFPDDVSFWEDFIIHDCDVSRFTEPEYMMFQTKISSIKNNRDIMQLLLEMMGE